MKPYSISNIRVNVKNLLFVASITAVFPVLFNSLSDNFSTCALSDERVTITGTVTDTSGAPVESARILFICGEDTSETSSGTDGGYSLTLELPPVSVNDDASEKPSVFSLRQNYPNPFNPSTTIHYETGRPAHVRLNVYNVSGQLVRTLVNDKISEGVHTVSWDATDDSGRRMGAGVYLCRMSDGVHSQSIRMTLVDGGGHSGTPVAGSAAKPADGDAVERWYDIIVTGDGYETYHENGFSILFDGTDIEKHIVLKEIERKSPVADAGPDQTVHAGNYVILDASGSYTDNHPLKYKWFRCDSNPFRTVIINEDVLPLRMRSVSVGFAREGIYSFYLVVSDSEGESLPDTVTVTVLPQKEDRLFRDPCLELAVRTGLENPSGLLTKEQLLSVSYLIQRVDFEKIVTLDGIEQCANLDTLIIGSQSIEDITPLASLTGLKCLDLNQNRVLRDISPLRKLTGLEYLNLFANNIDDISPLAGLVKLTFLNIRYNPITDISALENMTHLKKLSIHSSIKTIDALVNMIEMEELRLTNCGIEDITPLRNMTKMKSLRLYDNKYITDISALTGMTEMTECHLFGNNISDLSPLAGLHSLVLLKLSSNNISDLSPLVMNGGPKSLAMVFLNNNPLSEVSIGEYIPLLKERGVSVTWSGEVIK